MANQTALGFTIFAREHAAKAFKQVGTEIDRLEARMKRVRAVAGKGVGLAALAGGATALGAAVIPAAAAVAAMPAALVATKVASATLKVGLLGVGDAMSAVAEGDAKKLDEALEKLSPNARQFVRATAALKTEWDGVQRAVQDKLFEGLAAEMMPVAKNLLPSVRTGMVGVAAGFNAGAKEAARFANTPMARGAVNATFASTGRIMGMLAGATRPALQVITQLTVKSLPLAERMAAWATNGVKAAAAFLTSERGAAMLERGVTKAGDTLAQLGRIGGNVLKGLLGVFSQAKGAGDGLLDTLEAGTAKFAAWSRSIGGQQQAAATFKLLHDTAVAVAGVLPLVLGPLGAVVKLINGLPEPLREGAVQSLALAVVFGALASKLSPLVTGVGNVISAFTSADGPVQRFRDRIGGMDGATGKMRGALSGMVGFLSGPWGIALGAGAALLGIFATRNDSAERQVKELTDALIRNKGALDDTAISSVKNELQMSGAFRAAEQLGLALTDVTDAALGNKAAMDRVNAAIQRNILDTNTAGDAAMAMSVISDKNSNAARTLQNAVGGQNTALNEAREAYRQVHTASGGVVESSAKVTNSVNGVGAAADKATVKVNGLNTSLAKFKTLNGDADMAAIAFRDSLDDLTKAFSRNNFQIDQRTGKININSKAGREATRVLISSIQAAIQHSEKVRAQTGSVDKANKVFATEIERLRGVLKHSGLSRAEIDKLVARYAKLPSQINSATDKIRNKTVKIRVNADGTVNLPGGTKASLWASGGVLPGYTPGRDPHMFYSPTGGTLGLSGGEAVMRPEWTKAVGPAAVERMNAAARSGGVSGVRRVLAAGVGPQQLRGEGAFFASGGILARHSFHNFEKIPGAMTRYDRKVGEAAWTSAQKIQKKLKDVAGVGGPGVQNALKWARRQHGKPYIWAGVGPRGWDCSGFMGSIMNVIKGKNPHRRMFTTWSFGSKGGPGGFVRNANSGFRVGVTDAGVGHMAGTLGGVNVESRGSRGVVVGSAARGANNGLFSRRYGLRLASGGVMPWSFDNGGYLPEGTSLVHNGTGAPEPLANVDKMRGGDLVIREAHFHGVQDIAGLIKQVQKYAKDNGGITLRIR
ncbi:hypothetical protein [Nonomuraea sp. NPDC049480]|uniref:hypothetical protein n=1 Tax=Nonomuraea sp. NPDC049480 TaxID=3364353 RepID=UPI00379309F2